MLGIVINNKGLKINFVAVNADNVTSPDYQLQEGEQIIVTNWKVANTMYKPKWTGTNWVETATSDEISAFIDFYENKSSANNTLQSRLDIMESTMNELILGGM